MRPSRTGLATNVVWNRHRRFKAWPETWHTSMTCLASGHFTVEAVWLARTDIFYITLGTCLYLSCMARGSLTQPAHQGVINRWMTARTSSHWPQPPFQHRLYTHPSQPFRKSIAKQLTLESLLRQIYLPKEYIQCSLPVFAIMDSWLFLHMGTGCMVKHCRFKKFPKAYKIYSS